MNASPSPTPFLQRVAEIYAVNEPELLQKCCFVFPNKRSATFFTRYLEAYLTPPALLPATTSISQLVADISPLVEASHYDRLFILYNQYIRITKEPVDFDRFIYWGEMLLADFDDVDRYLVDADALFVNVKRFREISSNYLTPEQLRIISRFWEGSHMEDLSGEVLRFWQHTESGKGKAVGRFVQLWSVLRELYHAYHDALAARGLTSPGRLYRDAVANLENPDCPLRFTRYIFVGFNVLSASELSIFHLLQKRCAADFYWDLPSLGFRGEVHLPGGHVRYTNKAMTFMARNVRAFPSLYELPEEAPVIPRVEIVGVPSRVGQAKMAGRIVETLIQEKAIDPSDAIDTALVLPDESLFVSTVNSMPPELKALNVTMGYPLKRTPVATFMRTVTSLHLRSRRSSGEWWYFYEDVLAVLSHSVTATIDEEGARRLADTIAREHRFMVSARQITDNYPTLAPIFSPVENDRDITLVAAYISSLLDTLQSALDNVDSSRDRVIFARFILSYRLSLEALLQASQEHGVTLGQATAFQMIERALASSTVPMKGEPLRGLQVMGVLETRALDFTNVVFMSMNERIFPKKSYTRSFIPDALRRAYRMSTTEHQESIFAYYFFRLVSRARRVSLLYDSRTVGVRHSEMSRYLIQLLYTMRGAVEISHSSATFSGRPFAPPGIAVRKDERVRRLLDRFLTKGSGRNLSASSINVYIDCPLHFYLRHVEELDTDDPAVDYIDSSVYGKIVHAVAQNLYCTANPHGTYPAVVQKEDIQRWLSPADSTISDLTHRAIDVEFLKKAPDDTSRSELRGETLVTWEIVTRTIREMLRRELSIAPFTVEAAEYPIERQLELAPGFMVNVKQVIDRIDRVNGGLRIVDYKTGHDELKTPDWGAPFDPLRHGRPKAFVQIFFYCQAYREVSGHTGPIQPVIYKFRTMAKEDIKPLTIGKEPVEDYRDTFDTFSGLFADTVASIFDPSKPFTQKADPSPESCGFCKFRQLCGVADRQI